MKKATPFQGWLSSLLLFFYFFYFFTSLEGMQPLHPLAGLQRQLHVRRRYQP